MPQTVRPTTSADDLRLFGVRANNLKGFDLSLPLGKLIVVTGVSGSGKSSLVYDVIYAEGQRRFAETFPPSVRQHLPQFDRPNIDRAENVPAAVAVGQFEALGSKRTTVAEAAGLLDLLRPLLAYWSDVVCANCDAPIFHATPARLAERLRENETGQSVAFGFPAPEGFDDGLARSMVAAGFIRAEIDGVMVRLGETTLPKERKTAFVLVDRLTLDGSESQAKRIIDALDTAKRYGGRIGVKLREGWKVFEDALVCPSCGLTLPSPTPATFHPRNPTSQCDECKGSGVVRGLDLSLFIPDRSRSLREGAVAPLAEPANADLRREFLKQAKAAGLDIDAAIADLSPDQFALLERGSTAHEFLGLAGAAERLGGSKKRGALSKYEAERDCTACGGSGLGPGPLAFRFLDWTFADWMRSTITKGRDHLTLGRAVRQNPLAKRLAGRLEALVNVGLGYLEANRLATRLSSGEARRVALAAAIGGDLSETLFVLDEPTAGLHPQDSKSLFAAIRGLVRDGNTALVVEHDLELACNADWVIELGPGAGSAGGRVVFEGDPAALEENEESVAAAYMRFDDAPWIARTPRKPSGWMTLRGATAQNLKSIDVRIPLGVLTAVMGVSGAGKSSLIMECLLPAMRRALGDTAIGVQTWTALEGASGFGEAAAMSSRTDGRSATGNCCTYLKFWDDVRSLFAETLDATSSGLTARDFSFNTGGGRCERCDGAGHLDVDLLFMPTSAIRCPECKGRRYQRRVLDVKLRGRNVAEVLDLTARDAFGFFRNETKIQERLKALIDVGLGYMTLGQPTATYSGGEMQRLKLASYLGRATSRRTLFLFDEPSNGLHPADYDQLLECIEALLAVGHTVVIVEHRPLLAARVDWIVELGPGAGPDGGRLIAQGTPKEIAAKDTPTGRALRPLFEPD
jgi:excinuclease ABC subunit A